MIEVFFWCLAVLGYCMIGNGIALALHRHSRTVLDEWDWGMVILIWPIVIVWKIVTFPVTWYINKYDP